MCEAVKKYAQEYARECAQECVDDSKKTSAVNLFRMGVGIETIAKALERDSATVRQWVEAAPTRA